MPWKTELQPPVYPRPDLHRKWFSGRIVCKDEGWSFWFSASAGSRVDGYHYEDKGRCLTLGGEGGANQMDVFVPPYLSWDDAPIMPIEDASAKRILLNITAAIQWTGSSAMFFYEQNC
jgi:hypothetical protein